MKNLLPNQTTQIKPVENCECIFTSTNIIKVQAISNVASPPFESAHLAATPHNKLLHTTSINCLSTDSSTEKHETDINETQNSSNFGTMKNKSSSNVLAELAEGGVKIITKTVGNIINSCSQPTPNLGKRGSIGSDIGLTSSSSAGKPYCGRRNIRNVRHSSSKVTGIPSSVVLLPTRTSSRIEERKMGLVSTLRQPNDVNLKHI